MNSGVRCDAPGRRSSRRSSVPVNRNARRSKRVAVAFAFHCRKGPTHAQQLQTARFPAAIRQGARAAVRDEAQRNDIAPELLATRRDVEQLVFSGRSGHLTEGWRREVIGERLVALAAA